jgi:signal transduction histidine kinase
MFRWLRSDEGREQLAEAERSIAWVRLIAVAGLAAVILGPLELTRPGYRPTVVYWLLGFAAGYSAVLVATSHFLKRWYLVQAVLSSVVDIALISAGIYATGGARSELHLLYFTSTLAMAMRFGLAPAIAGALLQTAFYIYVVWLSGDSLKANEGLLAVRIVVLFVTAALAGGFHRELSTRLGVLVQTRKMRDDFLMVASHELRTPLVAIRGISQVLDRVMKEGSTERALLQRVDAAIERMNRLVRDLTDAARVDAGTLTLERSTVDLVSIARSAVDEARLGNPRREIKFRNADDHLRVEADATRLQQVFANLLTNALKFTTPDKGAIVLEVRRDGQLVLATVRDKGLGIPPESLPTIFEKHGRSTSTPAMGFAGLGLGLYITRAIVLAHGGAIGVESTQGEGSAFTIKLPLSPEPRLVPAAASQG